MKEVLKNSRVLLAVFGVLLVAGTGVFLFRRKPVTIEQKMDDAPGTMLNEQGMENGERQRGSSEEASDELVKKLEEGNEVPGEEQSTDTEQLTTDNKRETTLNKQLAAEEERGMEEAASNGEDQAVKSQKIDAVVNRLVSWGFSKTNGRKVDTVVIHSTYNATGGDPFSVEKILNIYKSYGVSPHYLIARDGTVYRLVEEKNVAYHAGESEMKDGRTNVNAFSIGIEIIGKDDGSPSDEQYAALKKLIADIKSRNDITHIVGHSDIAPGRKTDPWGFDWKKIGGKEL